MSHHSTHLEHSHVHGPDCGHKALQHGDHVDYLHDGHLHHARGNDVDECEISIGKENPDACTPSHQCSGHAQAHVHGPDCGHDAIPHGNHVDYLVAGHLHHPHGGHCDNHGAVNMA
jgi:hypothetical protein